MDKGHINSLGRDNIKCKDLGMEVEMSLLS